MPSKIDEIIGMFPFKEEAYFDECAYLKVKVFFEKCLFFSEGEFAGKPFILNDWENEIIANVYGWKDKRTGRRWYRRVSIWIPKGNGKTEFLAGIFLNGICNDEENSAEAYIGARSEDQADACYTKAQRFVETSPVLKKIISQEGGKLIYRKKVERNGMKIWDVSVFTSVSSDAKNFHSKSPSIVGIDELWNQSNNKLYTAMFSSRRSRNNSLLWTISTAGEVTNEFSYGRWKYDLSVLNNPNKAPHHFVRIFAADKNDDPSLLSTWKKANPSLGVSPKLEILEDEFNEAKDSPVLMSEFLRFHLNIWVTSVSAWLDPKKWAAGHEIIDPDKLVGLPCAAALDMSVTTDLTALVLAFDRGDKFVLLPFFFMPRETIRKRAFDDQTNYVDWMDKGFIIPCEGSSIDQNVVLEKIYELIAKFKIKSFYFDPYKATYIAENLTRKIPNVVKFPQNLSTFTLPSQFFEACVLDNKLAHNSPPLDWMAGNVELYKGKNNPNDNMRPVKPEGDRSRNKRIDGIVAAIMALSDFMDGATGRRKPSAFNDPKRKLFI